MNPSGARCWAVLILFLAIILATPAAEVTLVRLNAPHSAALASRSVATESSSSLVYSTYLGGAESNDVINGLAVDAAGNAYVTGYAASTDFPITPGAYNTTPPGGFLTKMNSAGSALVYSTLGLASPDAVAVDSAGNAYVTGVAGAGFPTTPGAFNASGPGVFVAKVSPAGDSLLYSTFIGDGYARAIHVTPSGEVVVAGSTSSKWFPTTPGAYDRIYNPGCSLSSDHCHDGFVARLNAFGTALIFSTFLGGSGDDTLTSVALDSAQSVYLAGYTLSKDFPTTPGAYNRTPPADLNVQDAFVAKLSATGSQLLYATLLGGSYGATASGISADAAGNAVVVGETSSIDFPTTPNRLNRTLNASDNYRVDGFVSKVNPSGSSLLYSTFLGGSQSDSASAVTIDASQQMVVAGGTASPDFPVTPGAPDAVYGGGMCGIGPDPCFDAFVSVINETPNGLVYSTYLGGNKDDGARALALGPGGVYVAGTADSMNFPVTPAAFQTTGGGTTRFNSTDGFLARLTASVNAPPTLGTFSAAPTSAIPGQPVTFSATASDANGDVLSYTLAFGDGTSAIGSTPPGGGSISASHMYAANAANTAVLTVNDGHGGTASSSTPVTIATSFLRVTTNPAVAGKILVDGVPRDEWGLAWMKIAPGTHTVSFGGLNGLATPTAQTVTTTSGATTTVQGNYGANGYLRVITNPALASTISVNGVPRNDWGMWTALPPGTYTVHFGLVAGSNPPADQTAIVTAGATTTITGTFTSNPTAPGPDPTTFGYLRVTTNPATAAQILVNGVPRDDWGLTWVKLAPGTYTVSFGQGYGYTPPAPQTFTVTAGATTTWDAPFVVHGSLRVTTNPALAATIFVDGVPRDDWGMWQSMPPGSYVVSFGPVPGYVTPASQTATVTTSSLTTIIGPYVAAPVSASAGSPSDAFALVSTYAIAAPTPQEVAGINVASDAPRTSSSRLGT